MRIKGYQFIGFYQTFIYILLIVVPLFISCQKEEKISFNRQIRPILNKNCLGCHGGVKQSGGLGWFSGKMPSRKQSLANGVSCQEIPVKVR